MLFINFKMKIILTLLTAFLVTSCLSVKVSDNNLNVANSEVKKPKNIILLIGDGMGLSQVSTGIYYQETPSNFERLTTIGLIKTSSSSDLITDSAAGATAFSAGVKTYNGAIGVKSDSTFVETILEQVSQRGISTGLIATSSIVHATPASFYAHVNSRRLYEDIADYLPTSEVDFFAGGGLKFFNKRKDGKNLLEELKANNFEVNTIKLPENVSGKKQAILLAEDGMPRKIDGRGDFLPKATQLALDNLSQNEKGFFLMVEGSQIDWGGHNNNAEYLIEEQLDFDKTVGVALDFAKKNGNTLVIVTADHETGGYTLASENNNYNKVKPAFSTTGHSATMVPVFTYGPGSSIFNGIFENTEIYSKMKMLFSAE